ncbi:MAG: ubiquinol-cytochrome c reductase cytochrome c subunit [Nocardioidaceae bacterium]|nr:ubiquinol-cytochrome c reductase cytochrome c subunit [Nocardioidaceae bacterium]
MRLLNRSLGRLSRHRRGPVAGLLVMLLGLILMGGLYAAFSPASAQTDNSSAQIDSGRKLFLVGCAFCHGQSGQGVKTLDGNQLGPALVGVGAAAVDFQVGTGRMPVAQPGAQIPQKEVAYTPQEIADLAAYVASLGPGPAIPNASDYDINGMTTEQRQEAIVQGGLIFRTNCTACHNFEGAGGAMPQGGYAPRILGVEPKYIYEAMLTGPQAMDNFSNGNLSPTEKKDIIAYLQSLKDSPEYGGFGLGGIGPVSEGLFAWLAGIGGLVGIAIWIAAHTARTSRTKAQL